MKRKNSLRSTALISFLLVGGACATQPSTEEFDRVSEQSAIRQVLDAQEVAWNQGNIEEFMKGYWKSDSLRFIGNGITTGWQATLDRYHKSYPGRAAMGELRFEFYRFFFVDQQSCLVTGRYTLRREADEPTGMFTLLIRKIDGRWLIVYDHTS